MVETSSEAHQTALLQLLARSVDGRLSAGDFKKKLAAGARKSQENALDLAELGGTLAGLVDQGLIAVSGGAKDGQHPRPNASYRLTEAGRQQIRPARPDLPDEQLRAQEAFVLLQVFRAKDGKLTRSELNAKLKSRAAIGQLEFDVKEAPETVEYHLATLVERGCLDEQRRGISTTFTFNPEIGAGSLASSKQHDAVSFTMSGATLNALLAAARRADATPSRPQESSPVDEADAPPSARPHDIMAYVDRLRSDSYAGKDLIPIYEVRRLVAAHHGPEAAGHSAFDPLIKQMRGDGQLELIAISDNRGATREQLDDSIPGMNETLFYIVVE